MSQDRIELNALRVLKTLLEQGSATAAARTLGISQPSVSAALARLRLVLGDDLFVRTPRGLEPTARAVALGAPIQKILDILDEEIIGGTAFEPAASDRCFTLAVGELGQLRLAPRLIPLLMSVAPRARLRFTTTPPEHRKAELMQGRADLAIGHFPDFDGDDIFQQSLQAPHRFVGIARCGHPLTQEGGASLEAFLRHDHVAIGQDYPPIYTPFLHEQGIRRRVVATVALMSGAPQLLEGSELVGIVPETMAQIFERQARVSRFELPFPLPLLEVKMFWHRRAFNDPAIVWLRRLLAQDFISRGAAAGHAAAGHAP